MHCALIFSLPRRLLSRQPGLTLRPLRPLRLTTSPPRAAVNTWLLLLALGAAPWATLEASEIPRVAPAQRGFDSQRLERIDARMQEAVDDGIMVGGHALIARAGAIVYDRHFGLADREAGKPMTADALYRIYSMSKPITAVALLMLYEEGRFLLEDPVAAYLPELGDLRLLRDGEDGEAELQAPLRQPSIRDLLRHTAGFSYGIFGDSAVDRRYRESDLLRAPTLEEFTRRLGALPLLLEPGTRWHYSVAVDVQGRLVEALSGMPFGEFLRERIFLPLDMRDTTFVLDPKQRPRLAQLYSPLGTGLSWNTPWKFTTERRLVVADPELTAPYLDGSQFESGGGGLISSTRDYLRFAMMLANGGALGEVRLLSPQTVKHMSRDHLQGIDNTGLWGMSGFGLGVGIYGDPAARDGELGSASAYGWGGAAGTNFWIDPENDLIGLFMVQSVPHQTPLSKRFKVLTYQALID